MIAPRPGPSADVGVLRQSLEKDSARIIAGCITALAGERKAQADSSVLETIQKNLPLFLNELSLLLPQVMAGESKVPPTPGGGIECRAEHRLDVVIKAFSGIGEVVVLELSRLKGSVADEFLDEACGEVRLFFDLKVANYCLQFVAAQDAEIALRARQLKDANEQLAGVSEMSRASAHSRAQLLQGVTHELRNSLQSVLLYATSLLESPREHGVTDVMERLAQNGVHLQKLLDRLQAYSPLLAGESHAQPEPVDVDRFLEELELRHRALARATRTELTCRRTRGPATISTDLKKLHLIADNLVTNALRAAKRGRVQVEVSAEGPERVLLSVTDDGAGISLVEARQIFRVLHHVSGAYLASLKLGLLASRHLAHLLGGEITFESEVGRGASFRVTLPHLATQR